MLTNAEYVSACARVNVDEIIESNLRFYASCVVEILGIDLTVETPTQDYLNWHIDFRSNITSTRFGLSCRMVRMKNGV